MHDEQVFLMATLSEKLVFIYGESDTDEEAG
jgi:hypothetical protein